MMSDIPRCPRKLPSDIGEAIHQLGLMWAKSDVYPAIERRVGESWRELINEWAANNSLPLLVRKSSLVRGSEIIHGTTGRALIPCDNSPAQWACHHALRGLTPTIAEIKTLFERDEIPVSFAHKKHEEAQRKYHCTLRSFTVNKADWKLCHIKPVGLRVRQSLEDVALNTLVEAFQKLIDPTNFFLVPKRWGGLGEAQEFIDGVTGVAKQP